MKKAWWVGCLALGLAIALAPAVVQAGEVAVGVGLNLNLGADDAGHFNFGPQAHHEHRLFQVAKSLQDAKHVLWNAEHRGQAELDAIHSINQSLDWLRWTESHPDQRHRGIVGALNQARNAKRALWHAHGHAKRDALAFVSQALGNLNHMAHRY